MAEMTQKLTKAMPFVFGFCSGWLPGIVQVYFVSSTALSYMQVYLMTLPKFREFFYMTRLPKIEKPKTIDTTKTKPDPNISFIDRTINKFTDSWPYKRIKKYIQDRRERKQTPVVERQEEDKKSVDSGFAQRNFQSARSYDRQRRQEAEDERQRRNRQRKEAFAKTAQK